MTGLSKLLGRYVSRAVKSGRPDRGVRWTLRYVRIRPQDPDAWLILGRVLIDQEMNVEAAEILRRGLIRHSNGPKMWSVLAEALVRDSKLEEARDVLREGKREHPESAWLELGESTLALAEGRFDDAGTHAENAGRRRGEEWEIARWAGWVLMQLPGGQQVAEEFLREAARRDTVQREAHLLLGVLLEETNPQDSAAYLYAAREKWRSAEMLENTLEEVRAAIWREDTQVQSDT